MALDEADQEKAAMGLFNFHVMPFGLSNALGVSIRLMSIVLGGMEGFDIIYLSDIMVFSRTAEEHFHHLLKLFDRLR